MANKAALVEQIKSIQRSDPDAKQAWWNYCDTNLGGIKDPNRHEANVLSEFVAAYGAPPAAKAPAPRRPAQSPVGGGGSAWGYPPTPPMQQWGYPMQMWAGAGGLGDFVKTGQRHSANWKAAWQSYCHLNGSGQFDPAKYDESFIVSFMDYVGQLAIGELGVVTEGADGASTGQKRPLGGAMAQPPAKRALTMPGKYPGGDGEKLELVDKIKALQRTDAEAKGAWWQFCDEHNQGIKDPNRHDKDSLQQFLSGYE
eukprot:CAMPEP_0179232500 /NCGR_PEP_ID=MMETSP0797-20121207/11891_1 /TAXON_ID=47934 /ORGANISM="Dinophysis acuminata, Strain DAEP01" /LENGTH=254 /DNA_ID=CAMNT_0020939621 /DNA_START=78 /DNA_END=842 /DNA_ORIENTATION=-